MVPLTSSSLLPTYWSGVAVQDATPRILLPVVSADQILRLLLVIHKLRQPAAAASVSEEAVAAVADAERS